MPAKHRRVSVPVYGVIDIGTNSVKFRLEERRDDGSWRTIVDRMEVTRLGQGLREGDELDPAAVERTVEVVADMAGEARRHGASALAAVGTMGLRTARNTDAFAAALKERLDLDLEVISGEEEARLAYVAAASGLDPVPGVLVVFDTGGGSTQFAMGRGRTVVERFSLNLGAVRLTERFQLDRRVSPDRLKRALAHVSQELARLDHVPHPDVLVGTGGAVTTMAAVAQRLAKYEPLAVQGSLLSLGEVDRQIEIYRSRDIDARRQIVGLEPCRADIILAGACVVRKVMEKLGREAVSVSDRGLRHGLLADRFG